MGPLGRVFRFWGSTEAERYRAMRGDMEIPHPTYEATLAVTIDAPPSAIWPWLVQMGYRRGGLYSYDWLDRLFGFLDAPSADRLLPEFQHLEAGEEIPIGRGDGFPVILVEPDEALVLGGAPESFRWTWEFALYRLERRTRLVSRNRAVVAAGPRSRLLMWLLEPAAFVMTRKMLLGIKRRAERLASMSPTVVRPAA